MNLNRGRNKMKCKNCGEEIDLFIVEKGEFIYDSPSLEDIAVHLDIMSMQRKGLKEK